MSHATATGFYQLAQSDISGVSSPLVDKYGAVSPLLHVNLRGIVADDISFVTNPTVPAGTDKNYFKVKTLPDGLTALNMRARIQVVGTDFTNGSMGIVVYNGHPQTGSQIIGEEVNFPTDVPGGRAATVIGTWYDFTVTITPGSITDLGDFWATISMVRGSGPSDATFRVSWLAFQATFPYGLGETPTYKNYVNSLARFFVSIRTVGTVGTSKYCYRVVPYDADGVDGPAADEVSIETGHATLDSTNHICLSWEDVDDASGYKIYRTCAPSDYGLGLLANISTNLGDCGGGGGGGVSGYKDDGSDCPNAGDCDDDPFSEDALEGCQEVSTVTYPAKETPS